jgi:hypothetical protein
MTPTDLTALTNQLMLAVSVYGDARVDVAEAHAEWDDDPARFDAASAKVRDADDEVKRLVRVLAALVPTKEA